MAEWKWYPGAKGYQVADKAIHVAVGCSQVDEHPYCWARRMSRRQKHLCSDCYHFRMHEHWERVPRDRLLRPSRIAYSWKGNLTDEGRSDETILRHFGLLAFQRNVTWLIQVRNTQRLLDLLTRVSHTEGCDSEEVQWWEMLTHCQFGTTFAGTEDIKNLRALAELPPEVVRFVAFEPVTYLTAIPRKDVRDLLSDTIPEATPNWFYIGRETGPGAQRGILPNQVESIEFIADTVRALSVHGCKVIFKPSCGPELYKLNEGVTLP